jgi:uncharacterized protein YecT (DUF1311 family)
MSRVVKIYCLVLAVVAMAANASFAETETECDDFPGQSGQKSCSRLEFDASEDDLNSILNKLRHRLRDDPDTLEAQVEAQIAWDAFARAECSFRFSGIGSRSMRKLIFLYCMSELTDSRTEELEDYLDCDEGDLGCPVPSDN